MIWMLLACRPEPRGVGDPEPLVDAFGASCTNCHPELAFYDPIALVGTPSISEPDLDYIEPGDPEASVIYRRITGLHAYDGETTGLMPPNDSGVGVPPDLAATVRAWILDAPFEGESDQLGDPVPAVAALEACRTCHGVNADPDLIDLPALLTERGRAYPMLEAGRPWRSAVYRVAIGGDHGFADIEADARALSPSDLRALADFIAP